MWGMDQLESPNDLQFKTKQKINNQKLNSFPITSAIISAYLCFLPTNNAFIDE